MDSSQRTDLTYQKLLTQLPNNNEALALAYHEMEKIVDALEAYVKVRYTSLVAFNHLHRRYWSAVSIPCVLMYTIQ